MKSTIPVALKNFMIQFAELYHQFKVHTAQVRTYRYKIVSSIEDYVEKNILVLALTDKPGDRLPPMTIEKIKHSTDIISNMHPVDVNSINDLYYLSKNKVREMKVAGNKITASMLSGEIKDFDISEPIDLNMVQDPRLSYYIGYLQAETFTKETYKEDIKYKLLRDNISTLEILDIATGDEFVKNAAEILMGKDYFYYSKSDVARIGFICGQMSRF